MGRKFRLSQRKGYQTSKPKQQPPEEEELTEDASCSTTFQSVAVQTDISCFDEATVAIQTDVSYFAEASVAIQTDVSCLDRVSPVAISSGLSCLESSSVQLSQLPLPFPPEPSSAPELPCPDIPIEMSPSPEQEMPKSPEHSSLPDSYLLEIQSTPVPKQSSVNPINLFGYLQQPLCEGNCDVEFLPLVEKYKGRFKNNSGTSIVAYYDHLCNTIRHIHCEFMLKENSKSTRCLSCREYRYVLKSTLRHLKIPEPGNACQQVDPRTNFRYLTTPQKLEKLRSLRDRLRKSELQVSQAKQALAKHIQIHGVKLDASTSNDVLSIMEANKEKVESQDNQFCKLFWEQQLKAKSVKGKQGMRWHPAIIRWCLYMHHRSSGAYTTLQKSGIISMPSERTLRDYRHFNASASGFSRDTDLQLLDLVKQEKSEDLAKYVTLVIDEMYIKEGLLYNKHSGALVGFEDLGDINNLIAKFECQAESESPRRPLAKCMLTFMVRGLFTSIKFVYAQFPASSPKGCNIFVLVWKAIERLTRIGFKVLAIVCDGAKNNRRMLKLHSTTTGDDVCYKTHNVYSEDKHPVFFICDPPHLIKTSRNCFSRGKLWCNGQSVDWNFIVQLYQRNVNPDSGVFLVPKLKREHVFLTSFSKMRVDLATQVLSTTVSKALTFTFGEEARETAKFVEQMDKFFDSFNVSSFDQGRKARKPFQKPYHRPKSDDEEDFRLQFLREFLSYLDQWRKSTNSREGFTDKEKKKMTLSTETQSGIKILISSFLELIPYLFKIEGVNYFLSEKLSQDPLEKFFGCQRQKGRSNENPTVGEFFKNTDSLRVINSIDVREVTGNCRGTKRKCYDLETSNLNAPLNKRKRRNSK